MATLAFTGIIGSGTARAEDEEPSVSEPAPSDTPGPIECSAGGTAGELPFGSQSISGTVTFGGDPVEGLTVYLGRFGNATATSTQTNPLGEYQFLDLGVGSYTVAVDDGSGGFVGGFWDGNAAPLAVDPAEATPIDLTGTGQGGIDVALAIDTPWTVSGSLTDHLGQPVPGAEVRASGTHLGLVACADATGDAFTMTNVDSGLYRIGVSAPGYPDGYYRAGAPGNFTTRIGEATHVAVEADISGIAIAFPELYALSGSVVDGDGQPVDGFMISAGEVGGGASGFGYADPSGFTLNGLPAGEYLVSYSDGLGIHRSGWYAGDGVPGAQEQSGAVSVTVPGPAISILAEEAPTISGRITDAETGEGVAAGISFCDLDQEFCLSAGSGEDGYYTVAALYSATYYAQVFPSDPTRYPSGGYITSGGSIEAGFENAAGIAGGDTDVTVDAVMPQGGRIEVQLTSGGSHIEFPYVQFCIGDGACGDATWDYDAENDAQSMAYYAGSTLYAFYDEDFDGNGVWLVDGGSASGSFDDATPLVIVGGGFVTISSDIPPSGVPTTPEHPDITVDDGNGTALELSFAGLDGAGVTTVMSDTTGPDVPEGFQLGVPATYWDISTTATGWESVQICIPYGESVTWIAEANLRLFHYDTDTGAWEDITDAGNPDLDTHTICGTTDSLSPFVLAEPVMTFSGFFQPVDNGVLNKVKAGAGVPVKFSLGGDFGLDIFTGSTPSVSVISCTSSGVDTIEQTVAAGDSHLTYDAASGTYSYVFKTSKSWAGSCRRLTLAFTDGTVRTADFTFTK